MSLSETVRSQLSALIRKVPFTPFAVILESGDRVLVRHPENVAFDPANKNRDFLFIIGDDLVHYGTLSAVTSVAMLDQGQTSAA